jgi:hypothetical protein
MFSFGLRSQTAGRDDCKDTPFPHGSDPQQSNNLAGRFTLSSSDRTCATVTFPR